MRRSRRQARRVGALGFAGAVALPLVLWHRTIDLIATGFRLDVRYLVTGWTPFALMLAGLLFCVPVLVSIGRNPESRLYPRARNAYLGWGVTLYLLGFGLATQVSQIIGGLASP
jgi:hypothetical protein